MAKSPKKAKAPVVDKYADEDEELRPTRRKKQKTWAICYSLPADRKTWWMLKVRAGDEKEAWENAKKRLTKKEKGGDQAEMIYVKCVEADERKK
jgi:hypothetical protein